MSNRYDAAFSQLKAKNQGAFVPFVTIGDPDKESSMAIIDALVAGGADALELGIPFSDPVADGPTIQGANIRALNSKVSPPVCLEILSEIRAKYPDMPIGLLLYANLVYSTGIENFYQKLVDAGVDSVLVADVPVEASQPFREAATKLGLDSIFIAPPNADASTLKAVAKYGSGYTYLLSRAGVTGAEVEANMPVDSLVKQLKDLGAAPALLGFGISNPEQVKAAVTAGAAGAICGSAIVKIIEKNLDDKAQLISELTEFVRQMKAATQL